MTLQDKIKRSINLKDLASVKQGFNRLWVLFQSAPLKTQKELLGIAEFIRPKLTGENYEWKTTLKRIDGILYLMRKMIK